MAEKIGEITQEMCDEKLTALECLGSGTCQETEGFKGTEHEGLDMCEDGCVWYTPGKCKPKN